MESYINLELSQYPYLKEDDLNLLINCSGDKTADEIKWFTAVLTSNENSFEQENRLRRLEMFLYQRNNFENNRISLLTEIIKILQEKCETRLHQDGRFRVLLQRR
jgi:hypothetical protein